MKNSIINKKMKISIMIMSLISIPVMIMLMFMPRTYSSYMGNPYELNYWWETLVLTVAVSCIVCRACRRSLYSGLVIKASAVISVVAVVLVTIMKSWWGLVKLCDKVGTPSDGVFVFMIMLSISVMVLGCMYYIIGRFVADKKAA